MPEFEGWPKIPRLVRNCVVTEKIDGTNAAVLIVPLAEYEAEAEGQHEEAVKPPTFESGEYGLYAQSRKRFIVPGDDNYGFAAWVGEHADELVNLGPGRHFGEWWGKGIQRNYGLDERRFSLFNSGRWTDKDGNGLGEQATAPDCCHVVPVVTLGNIVSAAAEGAMASLEADGSRAAPGFDDPEGIVVYHSAGRVSFKATFDQDDLPKSLAEAGVVRSADIVEQPAGTVE